MGTLTNILSVLARLTCSSRKCSAAELVAYSVLAFETTMTLCKEMNYFSLLVNFGRWIKGDLSCGLRRLGVHIGRRECTLMWGAMAVPTEQRDEKATSSPNLLSHCPSACAWTAACAWNESNLQKESAKCCFLFSTQPLGKCLGGLMRTGTKEPLMAQGDPRKQWCHLRRHCGHNSPRGSLLSFAPAPDQRPQGKWILRGGGVSCYERKLVYFTAMSQQLCSSGENQSSIINSLLSVERSRAAGSRELKEALQGKQKKALRGK